MFQRVPLSIIRSFSLYMQHWYMSYSLRAGSGWNCSSIPMLLASCQQTCGHIPLLCVQWKTPDDGQRNCLKHVEFCSKNKFEKLMHLVGFIIRLKLWGRNCNSHVQYVDIYKSGSFKICSSSCYYLYCCVTHL
jgi:hypothetical protein